MKLKIGDSVFVWYLETFLNNRATKIPLPFFSINKFPLSDKCTIISEKVFKSELFQTLLEEKINGFY